MATEIPIEEIRRRVDARLKIEWAKASVPRPKRPGKSPSLKTRKKLALATFNHAAARALADPTTPAVKRARLERGLTLGTLSTLSGLHFNTIWNLEHGKGAPRHRTLYRVAEALEVPLDSIRNG